MLTTKVLRIVLKGDFLCVGRERLWKKEQHRNQKALEKQRIRTALRELLWGAVLRLRPDSMTAGPVQPHTDENSEARGASAGYFGRQSSIPSRS